MSTQETTDRGLPARHRIDRNPRQAAEQLLAGGLSMKALGLLVGATVKTIDEALANPTVCDRLRHMKSLEKVQAQAFRLRVKALQQKYDVPAGIIAKLCEMNKVVFQQVLERDRGFISLTLASRIADVNERELKTQAEAATLNSNLQFAAEENLHRLRDLGFNTKVVLASAGVPCWNGEILPTEKLRVLANVTVCDLIGGNADTLGVSHTTVKNRLRALSERREWRDIAAAARMSEQELRRLANLDAPVPYKQVERLLGLRVYDVRPRRSKVTVPAALTVQRIRSLATLGYSGAWLQKKLSLSGNPSQWRGNKSVPVSDAATIAAFYSEFYMTHGPSDATRALARQRQYPAPLAWNDSPHALAWTDPDHEIPDLDNDAVDFVDEVAIDVACDMTLDPPCGLTREEKSIVVERLLAAGQSLNVITERARVDRRMVCDKRRELGYGTDLTEDD